MKAILTALFIANALLALALALLHDASFPFNAVAAVVCYFAAERL